MKKFSILLISVAFLITGCSVERLATLSSGTTTSAQSTSQVPDFPSVTESPGQLPTETFQLVETQAERITQDCFITKPSLPDNHEYDGAIVFESYVSDAPGEYVLFDLRLGRTNLIPGKENVGLSVSPDRKMYAMKNNDTKWLELYTADGKLILKKEWQTKWGKITGWIDNQQIAFVMSEEESPGSRNDLYPPAILVMNLFTDQSHYLEPNYPDIDNARSFFGWDNYGATVYNNSLSRVVYPGDIEFSDDPFGTGYILYGIPEKKKIAEIPNSAWVGHPPIWSPDNSRFLMKGVDEFYLVGDDGNFSKISRMNPLYNPITRKGSKYDALYYSWSPDERHVAFWLVTKEDDHRTLAILDTNTGNVTNTCIRAGYGTNDISEHLFPVWSMDGKTLVVAANYDTKIKKFDSVLIDLEKHEAYRITNDLNPLGWLFP